ncbi:MAG TPA: 2-C-methyl-D-erythritol 4-phosphate cytidylyltransferase [Haloplasmataceae bacterium]
MNYSALVLAAGNGKRMNLGFNKMLLSIHDKPLITLALQNFIYDDDCTELIIVINKLDEEMIIKILHEHNLFNNKCNIVCGSYERQLSVYNGLKHVTNDLVLVHDGARPFITIELIKSLVREAYKYDCAIPGVKVKDTIKYVEEEFIINTISRHNLYAVQTPQACKTKLLLQAHELALQDNFIGTDEASLLEKYLSVKVKLVESNYDNIKITTKEDILLANLLYNKYFT